MKEAKKEMPTPIRLPQDLKRWVRQQAELNNRSMNGEIVNRLEQSRRQQMAREVAA